MEGDEMAHSIILDAIKELKSDLKETAQRGGDSRKEIHQRINELNENLVVVSTQLTGLEKLEMRDSDVVKESIKYNSDRIILVQRDLQKLAIKSAGFGAIAGIMTALFPVIVKLLK